MFIRRAELIAEDETVEKHMHDMSTEAALLAADRNGPGLFHGMFKSRGRQFGNLLPIHDHEDNVSRCPLCSWEIEDGFCSTCGFDVENPHGISEGDSDDDDDDGDDDDDDESDESSVSSVTVPLTNRPVESIRQFHFPQIDSDDTDEESEFDLSDMDRYDEHDDFIDNENEEDADDMDGVDNTLDYRSEVSSQYSDGTILHDHGLDTTRTYPQSLFVNHEGLQPQDLDGVATNYDESDDDDDESVRAGPVRPGHSIRRRPIVITDDEDEAEEVFHNATEGVTTDEDDSNESDDASGSSSASSSASSSNNADEDGEESDDTAIPPQSGRSRRARLENHRARRPDKNVSRAGRVAVDIPSRPQSNRAIFTGNSLRGSGRRSRTSSRSTYVC